MHLQENGTEFTAKFVAMPGHSEHQTGLAIDLGLRQPDIDFIRPAFPYEGICQKFRELAPAFGFIERCGPWESAYSRFRKWIDDGIPDNIFRVPSMDAELQEIPLDASIVQARQHKNPCSR